MEEIRNAILLVLALVGGFITIRTFISSTRQRKIDNTYKTLDFLRTHINKEQIQTFIDLFHANNELSGVAYNKFKFKDGRSDSIEEMFSEGGCGNGDIQNMIELFNLISPTMNRLEIEIIWYEFGQIISKLYQWTDYLERHKIRSGEKSLNIEFYTNFNKFMKVHWNKMLYKPIKYYTYAE